jgi:hypothetical protein
MSATFSQSDLESYLDETLPADEMARIEAALRDDSELAKQLVSINGRRDSGIHSLGAIWRRHHVSCATREQLGSYLLGALTKEHEAYLRFHIETIGCRYCQANLADLRQQQQQSPAEPGTARRQKYFQSSAGYLGK